ncbi:MAG: hypothetical protein K6E34_00405 [Lachnospiraceae bacterium]|nr:hypothetical protein [Lachnospiraceae bacterium]
MEYTKDIETEDFIDKVANDCIANMTEDIKKEFIGDPDPDDLSNEIIVRIIEIVNGSDKGQ